VATTSVSARITGTGYTDACHRPQTDHKKRRPIYLKGAAGLEYPRKNAGYFLALAPACQLAFLIRIAK
jgi:hypothetical protein